MAHFIDNFCYVIFLYMHVVCLNRFFLCFHIMSSFLCSGSFTFLPTFLLLLACKIIIEQVHTYSRVCALLSKIFYALYYSGL